MYRYDAYDQRLVDQRVAQFREQTQRFQNGELTEAEFLPLRLQNGLYLQRHAPMLRIAVPYGLMSARQLRGIAAISRRYDKGYVHFTTRQNIQLNWPALADVPDILAELASIEMHAIQTSGNCVRNTTTDQFAGVCNGEVTDPRPWCEIIRQWSTLHPEFTFLPRKFKIAVNGARDVDRAAIRFHDIGLQLVEHEAGEVGFQVFVGGGQGRTPVVGQEVRAFLPQADLLSYLNAILRIYNLYGRRDNKYKARIKILVKAWGIDLFRERVEQEWRQSRTASDRLTQAEIDRVSAFFTAPDYQRLTNEPRELLEACSRDPDFKGWLERNVEAHKQPGYAAVTLSLKTPGCAPGDATAEQLDEIAALAERYSYGELRVSHQQNLILADVQQQQLPALYQALQSLALAAPTVGTLADITCCPGGDYCALANAKSIPIAEAVQTTFDDLDYLHDLGDLKLNISGCMNACGHHHVGNIGVLGVDKKGTECYQISLGGDSGVSGRIGKILGPSFLAPEVPTVIEKIVDVYVEQRQLEEKFVDTVARLGLAPFKERVYANSP